MIKTFQLNKCRIILCVQSVKGINKKENQDSYYFGATKRSFVISVCDGLGSAKKSALGSKKASELLVNQLLGNRFSKDNFQVEWLAHFSENTKDYNTTAKFVRINGTKITYGGVGDGLIAFKDKKKITSLTNRGDFSNQTSCIFDLDYFNSFIERERKTLNRMAILISTDGFSEDIKEDGLSVFLDEVYKSFSNKNILKEFDNSLASLLNNWPNQTNGDDKTVAFLLVERKI